MWWTPKTWSLLCSKFLPQWKHKASKTKGTTSICPLLECLVKNRSFLREVRSTIKSSRNLHQLNSLDLEHLPTMFITWPTRRSLATGQTLKPFALKQSSGSAVWEEKKHWSSASVKKYHSIQIFFCLKKVLGNLSQTSSRKHSNKCTDDSQYSQFLDVPLHTVDVHLVRPLLKHQILGQLWNNEIFLCQATPWKKNIHVMGTDGECCYSTKPLASPCCWKKKPYTGSILTFFLDPCDIDNNSKISHVHFNLTESGPWIMLY